MDGWSCENVPHPERPDYLTSECTHSCGNGLIDDYENCDDGNLEDGDGCSDGCRIEPGWNCSNSPDSTPHTSCEERCGDGLIVGEEECDDRNEISSDGCSDNCQLEEGWSCIETSTGSYRRDPSIPNCTPVCGDTLIRGDEECDDGNTTNGDGCSESCGYEPEAMCCVCQYQDFLECHTLPEESCATNPTADDQFRCRFHNGECKSEFRMNCDEWAANEVVQTACEFGPIVQEVGSSFPTSCPSLYYMYSGHGNCDIAQSLVRACVSCATEGGCRAISINLLSCSSFPNLEAVYAMAEDVIRPNLQPGDVVQVSAEQNCGFTDQRSEYQDFENKITLTLEYGDADLDVDYANCDDPSEFVDFCLPEGAISICKESSPPSLVTNICCPSIWPPIGTGAWHRTDPENPVCPGKCREESLCFASRPAHQSSCTQVRPHLEYDIYQCLHLKMKECEESGGLPILPPYFLDSTQVELDSSTGQCQASYEAVCMKSC
jgi:cysteine-rich repeat protein